MLIFVEFSVIRFYFGVAECRCNLDEWFFVDRHSRQYGLEEGVLLAERNVRDMFGWKRYNLIRLGFICTSWWTPQIVCKNES